MSEFPPSVPAQSVQETFPSETVPENTYELALVLGGTVSAGAYTAGVLDFLFEALEEWDKARADEDRNRPGTGAENRVPRHRVVVRVISGTSGGGLNAVMAARALSFRFPHISPDSTPASRAADGIRNPFYHPWVNAVDIRGLLATTDLESSQRIPAGLCCDVLDKIGRDAMSFSGDGPCRRPYLANPLPVFITYTNMSGVPYRQDFGATASGRNEYFVDHADFLRFVCALDSGAPCDAKLPPDSVFVGDTGRSALPWSAMVDYALGTAAFPLGLTPRTIRRSAEHYRYRYVIRETETAGQFACVWLKPAWKEFLPDGKQGMDDYAFLALDGGCMNNEPIELARTWLSGVGETNPRKGESANRGVILVDPFAANPGPAVSENPGLPKILFPTIDTLIEANRFATADLALFSDEKIFSRFLITPVRSNPAAAEAELTGGDAIAGSRLGAFLGFMCHEFRDHDFMLGRRNCQAFLKWTFTLPESNGRVFSNPKPARAPDPKHRHDDEIPIIPLYGTAAAVQPEPKWPSDAFDPEDLRSAIQYRIQSMLPIAIDETLTHPVFRWMAKLGSGAVAAKLTEKAIKAIGDSLDVNPGLR